ncbi:hypothetical protein ACI65C_006324 [Semiaphis heraclei]
MDYEDTILLNRNCYPDPLRLRGGGDEEDDDPIDVEMTQAAGPSGDMGIASCSQKRGPPSPGSPSGLAAKLAKTNAKRPEEIDEVIGWLEHTIITEKDKKKIGVLIAEKMLDKLSRLRAITRVITHENSRLEGEVKGKEKAQKESLTIFINKLDSKNLEVNRLTTELRALKNADAVPAPPAPVPAPVPTYAAKTAVAPPKTVNKPKKTNDKDQYIKSRNVKASSRFLIEIPQEMSVTRAKASVWESVKTKTKLPKAKTITNRLQRKSRRSYSGTSSLAEDHRAHSPL